MNLFRSSPLCQVTQGEEFVRPPTEGVGGESERLAVLNLTETLIYLGAISLEINFSHNLPKGENEIANQ